MQSRARRNLSDLMKHLGTDVRTRHKFLWHTHSLKRIPFISAASTLCVGQVLHDESHKVTLDEMEKVVPIDDFPWRICSSCH